MSVNEYIEWYKEHFGIPPSERLIEKFIIANNITATKIDNTDINNIKKIKGT